MKQMLSNERRASDLITKQLNEMSNDLYINGAKEYEKGLLSPQRA